MSSSAPSSSSTNAPLVAVETHQPTVRVMRLYKPGFHLVSTLPFIPCEESNIQESCTSDFSLSEFLLLPDSFGDIYSGEKFSAYIAVVNGYLNVPFYQVSLAIRLQTTSTVIDLLDTRLSPGSPPTGYHKNLSFNDASDMIVQHTLTELGIHTLRVSVQYLMTPTGETKTLRKFYRFNVLQPLRVASHYIELDGRPMVQCQVTNATKTSIFVDEMNFVPQNKASTVVALNRPKTTLSVAEGNDDDEDYFDSNIHLLQPEESYAFAFLFAGPEPVSGVSGGGRAVTIGHPEVRWCATMGEFSVFRAEDTLPKSLGVAVSNLSTSNGSVVRTQCIACPSNVVVGQQFEVTLRVSNASPRPIPMRLICLNTTSSNEVYYSNATCSNSNMNNGGSSSKTTTGGSTKSTIDSASPSCLGLCVTGLTYLSLGKIESGEFVDVNLTVFALCAGLHDLQGIYAVDSVTKQRYSSDSLCRVFVVDSSSSSSSEEMKEDIEKEFEEVVELQ